jgi:membrane protein implicated in regulation of membrane protease activity
MPIPFIFPIVGALLASGGMAMIVGYLQADQEKRNWLDEIVTSALHSVVAAYLWMRFGIDLGSLTPEKEKQYWREFGTRLQVFLSIAEPAAQATYGRPFAELKQEEQAEIIRKVARDIGDESATS